MSIACGVERWIKGKGKQNIPQPSVVAQYNRGMGGVDLLDRALADMRPIIRGRKWITNVLNIGFVYSRHLFTIVSGEHAVSVLIRRSPPHLEVRSRPTGSIKVADEIRLDGFGH